ncbi:hypothetical protein [Bradyrhizobium sp. BR13661]|jgi:hypothetical protein|uniref:hypothetical protein n=1 Tax=Bradyrhizobium sp. BR13661 TaxID=2940622 RepID=UPI002475D696|nr:hypothetical protein [Bradyrhizobium sp. BR13661]MDH6260919.1 hypothetical protein [Bradyrhizobium sp. BR13661]
MALTKLQSDILRLLAKNRSETSYLAGGLMLNKDWQRRSDDIDIFHDTDEEVTETAKSDLALLEAARFETHRDFIIYGCVDATVSRADESTIIQWFAETKLRFFPLVRDEEWGARLHQADLAINKILAAAGRSKARDIADLVAIGRDYCPLGPLVLAAAGKPPNFSPRRTIDEIRRHALSIPADEFAAVKGLPAEWSAAFIRDELLRLIEAADRYVMSAPPELIGILAVGKAGVPMEVSDSNRADAMLRRPTAEPEVMPAPADFNAVGWTPDRP